MASSNIGSCDAAAALVGSRAWRAVPPPYPRERSSARPPRGTCLLSSCRTVRSQTARLASETAPPLGTPPVDGQNVPLLLRPFVTGSAKVTAAGASAQPTAPPPARCAAPPALRAPPLPLRAPPASRRPPAAARSEVIKRPLPRHAVPDGAESRSSRTTARTTPVNHAAPPASRAAAPSSCSTRAAAATATGSRRRAWVIAPRTSRRAPRCSSARRTSGPARL